MRYAIFSDIHANRQALAAVLRDMRSCGAEVLVCLGDVIGYGPCPQIVLDAVRKNTPNLVLGNHDAAACGQLDSNLFNDHAREVIEWTRKQMNEESLEFLNETPMTMESEDILFVHAEIEMPARWDYIEDVPMATQQFKATDKRITFVGHTHFPVVFAEGPDGKVKQLPDKDQKLRDDHRYIVNVGSVGEPRDPNEIRARYAVYDSEKKNLFFRKVEFDVAAYRKDLKTVGLDIEPFFLTVDDGTAKGEAPAEVKRDMKTVVNVSPAAFNAKPKKLVMPGGAKDGEKPAPSAKLKTVTDGEAPKTKTLQTVAPTEPTKKTLKVAETPKSKLNVDEKAPAAAAKDAETAAEAAQKQHEAILEKEEADRQKRKKKRLVIHLVLWTVVLLVCGIAGYKLWDRYAPSGRGLGESGTPCGSRLISYFTLDNTLDAADGLHRAEGGVMGLAAFGHNGQFGMCLKLDQTFETFHGKVGDYALGIDSMTASIWFRFDSGGRNAEGILLHTGDIGWTLRTKANTFVAEVRSEDAKFTVQSAPVDGLKNGQWQHAVVVFNRETKEIRLFHNGKGVGKGPFEASGNLDADNELSIGGGGDDNINDFPGAVDDVAIWDRALASDEIADLFKFGQKGESLEVLLEDKN